MTRANIDDDDDAVEWTMERHGLRPKRDAVNVALHQLYRKPTTVEEMLATAGMGWGDRLELGDIRPGSTTGARAAYQACR